MSSRLHQRLSRHERFATWLIARSTLVGATADAPLAALSPALGRRFAGRRRFVRPLPLATQAARFIRAELGAPDEEAPTGIDVALLPPTPLSANLARQPAPTPPVSPAPATAMGVQAPQAVIPQVSPEPPIAAQPAPAQDMARRYASSAPGMILFPAAQADAATPSADRPDAAMPLTTAAERETSSSAAPAQPPPQLMERSALFEIPEPPSAPAVSAGGLPTAETSELAGRGETPENFVQPSVENAGERASEERRSDDVQPPQPAAGASTPEAALESVVRAADAAAQPAVTVTQKVLPIASGRFVEFTASPLAGKRDEQPGVEGLGKEAHAGERASQAIPPAYLGATVEPGKLFAPRSADRSPAAWAARLARATQPPAPAATPPPTRNAISPEPGLAAPAPHRRAPDVDQAAPQPARTPEPLPQAARRFLRPLMGVDPAQTPIYRDEEARALARSFEADAVATGDTISLGEGGPIQSARTLGLLAHELTHVARQRSPRFVPPVLAPASPSLASYTSPDVPTPPAPAEEEEALARATERATVRIAQQREQPEAQVTTEPAARRPKATEMETAQGAPAPDWPTSDNEDMAWGNLPAPWEPLPPWILDRGAEHAGVAQPFAEAQATASVDMAQTAHEPTAMLQRAAYDRPREPAPSPAPDVEPQAEQPEPDLDALAQQVYARLRRRLAAERRREDF